MLHIPIFFVLVSFNVPRLALTLACITRVVQISLCFIAVYLLIKGNVKKKEKGHIDVDIRKIKECKR